MKDTPKRNQSRFGWWVATIVERFEFEDESNDLDRKCRAWSNVVILKASCREEAYQKAIIHAENSDALDGKWESEDGRIGRWRFEGLSSLLPVYNELNPDGTEILFDKHDNTTYREVRSWIKQKQQLEVFDDSDPVPSEPKINLIRRK